MSRSLVFKWIGIVACSMTACTSDVDLNQDILTIGDSLLDYHTPDADIATVAAGALDRSVALGAVGGSTMLGEDNIADTYGPGDFQLLIASGGGNDLEECECGVSCDDVIDALIAADGSGGAIPDLVERALSDGKTVAWVGYMRPLADAEAFSNCGGELDMLRVRLSMLDDENEGLTFVDGALLGTGTERALYEEDGYHPSPEGCEALGLQLAQQVEAIPAQ